MLRRVARKRMCVYGGGTCSDEVTKERPCCLPTAHYMVFFAPAAQAYLLPPAQSRRAAG